MLRRVKSPVVPPGTPEDLIEAAALGARIAARYQRIQGLDPDSIRRRILAHYAADLEREGLNCWSYETLMATVARAVDAVVDQG